MLTIVEMQMLSIQQGKEKKGYDFVVLLNSFESTIDDLFQLFFFDWLYTLVSCVLFWTKFVIPLLPLLIYDINVWYMFTIYYYYNCFHLINISLKEQQLIIKLTSNISSCHNEIYVSKCPSSAYFNDC